MLFIQKKFVEQGDIHCQLRCQIVQLRNGH